MYSRVLMNLLKELGTRDKCESCRALHLFFRYEFINTGARLLESI